MKKIPIFEYGLQDIISTHKTQKIAFRANSNKAFGKWQ